MTWPYRLILRAAEIEEQREAERQHARLTLSAIADGMDQGRDYVPGKNDPPADANSAHYDPTPYRRTAEALLRRARPWEYTLDKLIARRMAEEEAEFDKFEQDIGRLQA